jgi:hypothetical protein
MRGKFAGYVSLLLCLGACATNNTPGNRVPADFAGMMHSGDSGDLDREYRLLDEMGVTWVQKDFSWNSIQPAAKQDLPPDKWNWSGFDAYVRRANGEGKKILGMLLYDTDWIHWGKDEPDRYVSAEEIPLFYTYARETVRRYNGKNGYGKVDAWAIWNEPNLSSRFWRGTKKEFFTLTRETAQTIRELDEAEETETFLVGGVFNTLVLLDGKWVTGLFDSGAMEQVDAIAYHPYMPGAQSTALSYRLFRKKVARYGFADKIWVNEVGYPTTGIRNYGTEVAESNMPDVVTKTAALLAAEGAKTIFWYHLFDNPERDPNDSEDWFGLIWKRSPEDWRKKGGADAYALCARNLAGKTAVPGAYTKLGFSLKRLYFEGDDGSRVLLVWTESILLPRKVTLTLPGRNQKIWNPADGSFQTVGERVTYTLYPPGQADQNLKPNLLFFTWDAP